MVSFRIILVIILISLTLQAYVPQLMAISSTSFFNAEISQKLGPIISKQLNNYSIPDQSFSQKVDGVSVQANLSKINQTILINWKANILNAQDRYNFSINSKNINMTIKAHIEFKIAGALSQKGQLIVNAQKIQADTYLRFQQPKSPQSIGFDVQVTKLVVNSSSIQIKIQGKGLDNYIIKAAINYFKNRIPALIDNAVQNTVNPKISQITSTAIIQPFNFKGVDYIATVNTTEIPHFLSNELIFPVDLTLSNQLTNQTNTQIQNQYLPQQHIFDKVANVTVTVSSGMLNTVLWLINDAKLLHFDVFPSDLGANPPIALNTLNLSILMPEMNKKWPKKDVALRIQTASKPKHLYIRNGRILTAISLSVNFIVNLTDTSSDITQCLSDGKCISAITLNISLPLSLSLKITKQNFVQGIIHTAKILQIQKIGGPINVKLDILQQILNTIVQSSIPAVNYQLQNGMELDPKLFSKYNVTGVFEITRKDYMAFGAVIKVK